MTGYTFDEAMSASLHPARLLEIMVPFIFGRPDRILRGAWWGFAVSRGAPPYIYSLSWSLLATLLILVWGRRAPHFRFWIIVALTALLLSCGGYLPGAEAGYRLLPHVWRYPIKFVFVSIIAASVLAGGALDSVLAAKKRRLIPIQALFICVAASCGLFALFCLTKTPDAVTLLRDQWWRSEWRSDPQGVIEPLVRGAGWHLALLSGGSVLCFFVLRRRERQWRGIAISVLILAELLSSAKPLFPTVDRESISSPSPFAMAAVHLGLVYERAGKDLDAVRRGVNGRYPSDDVRWMAIAQARQAWATTGSMYGVRYAFNHDPDGSYPERIDYVADLLNQRTWPERLKWLRAAGVLGVVTYDPSRLGDGYDCVAMEAQYGVPAFLCALRDPLPEIRRSSHVIAVNDRLEAAVGFESSACDPVNCTVIEGGASSTGGSALNAETNVLSESGNRIEVATNGSLSGVLFIARPFRRNATAMVNGKPVTMLPANICFTAIPVPAGAARVSMAW
ncbi:MAG: hypothetical protein WB973_02515 [Thermoanaerobaculia bacterium]